MSNRYQQTYQRSLQDPSGFWAAAAADIHWYKPWDKVLDDSRPPFYRWFTGGQVNTCYNAIDRHVVEGRGEQPALIYDSPLTNQQRRYSFRELQEHVAKFAGVLRSKGVAKGDRVLIYMPAVPEAVIAMLASARLGAVHSVVFGGFASNELAVRINDATPKVVVCASCGIEPGRIIDYKPLLDGAISLASHKPDACVVLQREELRAELISGRDYEWHEEMVSAVAADCVPVAATDPLYILYTSGTTGEPKGVVRDNGGHMVALNWSMQYVYDVNPGDVFWAASDVGWVVGHSYIAYGPLLRGCTTILYEGKPVGTPDAGAFWRVISEHGVKALFTAPTAFRAIRREDPNAQLLGKYDLTKFETLFLAGERTDPDTLKWAQRHLDRPVIDHWWQTETGWAIAANCKGLGMLPVKPGSPSVAVPGWDVHVIGDDDKPAKPGQVGAIVCRLPLPPGSALTLWNADQRFIDSYLARYPGFYETADAGYMDEDGYLYIMARTDDIINVAGHRLSTGAIEEVLAEHPEVAECAVVGVADDLKGQLPIGLLVLNAGVARDHGDIVAEVIASVRTRIGPVAAFKQAAVVARLPKTRSGKILRGTVQKIADNEAYKVPATIEDPAVLDEITIALETLGYASARRA